ncbi:MAG: amidohydrolase family protein [Betaproteobacteria bacterium]
MSSVINPTGKMMVDLMLCGGTAITVDSERRVIRDMGIAIIGENIVFVGKKDQMLQEYQSSKSIDCTDKVIIPGFVNAHIHYSHHMSKGMMPDTLGPAVQSRYTHYNISPHLTVDHEVWGSKALLIEMLRGGTTTFLESGSYHPIEVLEGGIEEIGIKGLMGRRAFDRASLGHSSLMETTSEILQKQQQLLDKYGKRKNIKTCVTIVGMQRYTDELAMEAKKMADSYGVVMTMHESAWNDTVNESRVRNNCRPIEHLERLGVLGSNLVLVHMLYINQTEVKILAKHNTKVVTCPSTGLKLGYAFQFARFPEMLEAGIPVALGSDSSDCSNYHDMIRILNLEATIYKGLRLDPEIMGAERAIEMATINGAKALGLEHEIGSLEVGKKADIAIFETNRFEWRPMYSEIQALVHSATGDSCETVIINGKVIVDNKRVLTVDEDEILRKLRTLEKDMLSRTGLTVASPWKFI